MAITPVKIVLFLLGGTVAAGGTAYIAGMFDPFLSAPSAVDAAPATNTPKVAALPPSENPADSSAAKQPSGESAQPGAEVKVEPPSFDIVRVEPGGAIVIAGHAAANAKVEAIIGSRIIGTADAGPEGDFAIVLDKPLAPGDYSIVLRSTTPDNVVAMSVETAVVAVPDGPAGQVLALVEQPGKPSQLITVPEPKDKPADAAAVPSGGSADAESDTAASAASAGEGATGQAADQSAQKGDRVQQDVASAPEKHSNGEQDAGTQAPTAAGQPTEDQSVAETKQPAPQDLASADEEAKSSTKPKAGDGPKVTVEAVEIEGRKIFVAGSATPGLNLRAYANEILLGDTSAAKAGRFLIEAERDLPVGDYIIRVDALGADGVKVLARAAVPFEREVGENIAAVAPPTSNNETRPVQGATDGMPQESAALQAGAPASGSGASEGGQSGLVAPADAEPKASGESGVSVGEAGKSPSLEPGTGQQSPARTADAPPQDSASKEPANIGGAAEPALPRPTAESEALAPKLQNVDGSVIIRRGDTLWRISKRVYGRGVRYSTIYLANQDQIRDPHKIWPGQVFKVPENTGQGEKADMTRLGEQAIEPPVMAQ